jgi:hypothetical protein
MAHQLFFYRHVPKNTLLILLSFLCLPISALIVLIGIILSRLDARKQKEIHYYDEADQKTILVTGVSMTKGLAITRILSLYTPHHHVIGADIEHVPFTSPGRYSRSISTFHRLTAPDGENAEPYIDSLLSLIRSQKVDIWISCSSVVSAVEDGEVAQLAAKAMGPGFRAVQFSPEVVQRLHEKDSFISYIQSLDLPCPESHRCTSADEVLDVLSDSSSWSAPLFEYEKSHKGEPQKPKQYILKPIAVDDKARDQMMTLLPLSDSNPNPNSKINSNSTPQPSTSLTTSYIQSLNISPTNPFQLQQYIRGPEYCTHALVIRGTVRAFVACPSSDLLMHYRALPPDSALTKQMLQFTQTVARAGGPEFTGHLSFDFLAEGWHADERKGKDRGAFLQDAGRRLGAFDKVKLYAIECNPRAHTAVVLFQNTPDMAEAYLDLLRLGPGEVVYEEKIKPEPEPEPGIDIDEDEPLSPKTTPTPPTLPTSTKETETTTSTIPIPATRTPRRYRHIPTIITPEWPVRPYFWLGHDLVTLIIIPLLSFLWGYRGLKDVVEGVQEFYQHVTTWQDGTFIVYDPLPFFVLYHVYWPVQFARCLVSGKRWTRINVSTTKVFEAGE